MTLTAMIGALVALLPPTLLQPKDKDSAALKLARSNARLIDHIQSLERELLTERHLTQTRIEEIENLHRDLSLQRALTEHWREEAMRIAGERQRQWRHPDAIAQQQQALGAYCNCVPSRAQAWGAQHSLVSQLNREGER